MGKTYTRYTRCWTLGWGIAEVSLPLWKRKYMIQREKPEGKWLESSWVVFNSFFINNKGPSHALKGCTFFSNTFAEKFLIQITWNTILYHRHPSINYGKLLVLFFFFFSYFPNPRPFTFSFDLLLMIITRQQDPNSTSLSDESILRIFYNLLKVH